MAKAPLISVVMAVYNGEKYLRESIRSVLDQTCSDFEYIIINDGSVDGTDDILAAFAKADKRIKIIRQENQGLAQSLNNGIQVARGEFIARMDDDDIALLDRLETQSQVMLKDRCIGLCHSLFGLIDSGGRAVPFRQRAGFHFSSLQTQWTLIWRNCICHPSVMIRRAVLEKHHIAYDASVICQDYDLWCRLIEKTEFYTIPKPLLLLRKHRDSVSAHYNENYLSTFSGLVARNLEKYIDQPLDQKTLRAITLVSGQMHLRGQSLTCRIDDKDVLPVLESVTAAFIDRHAPDKKAEISIQRAVSQQLVRWAQQACFHNKKTAIKFLIEGLSRYFCVKNSDGR